MPQKHADRVFWNCKVNLPNPALYGLCVEADECDNIKELPDLEEYMRIIEIEI